MFCVCSLGVCFEIFARVNTLLRKGYLEGKTRDSLRSGDFKLRRRVTGYGIESRKILHVKNSKISRKMAEEKPCFKKDELLLLLRDGVKPGWWDKEAHKITYKIASELFNYCFELPGKYETYVMRALKSLDPSLVLPKTLSNLKRKVNKFLSNPKNSSCSIIENLYDKKPTSFIGNECEKIHVDSVFLEKLNVNIIDDNTAIDKSFNRDNVVINNGVAVELFHYKNSKGLTTKHLINWLCFLCKVGPDEVNINETSLNSKLLRIVNKIQDLRTHMDCFL